MREKKGGWARRTAAVLTAAILAASSVPVCLADFGILDMLTLSDGGCLITEFDGMSGGECLALVPWEGDGQTAITALPWNDASLTVTFDGETGTRTTEGIVSPTYKLAQGESKRIEILSTETSDSSQYTEYGVTLYRAQELGLRLETTLRDAEDGSRQLCAALYGSGFGARLLGLTLRFDPACLQLADQATNMATEDLSACLAGTPQLAVEKGDGVMFLQKGGPDTAVLDNEGGVFRATFAAYNGVPDEQVALAQGGTLLGTLYFRVTDESLLSDASLAAEAGNPTGYGAMPNGAYADGVVLDGAGETLLDGTLTYPGILRVNGLPSALEAAARGLLDAEGAIFGSAQNGAIRVTYPDGVVTLTRAAGASGPIGAQETLTLTQTATREGYTARGWVCAGERTKTQTLTGTLAELTAKAPVAPRFGAPAYEPEISVKLPPSSGTAAGAAKQTKWQLYSLGGDGGISAESGGGKLGSDGAGLIEMESGTYRLEVRRDGCLPYVVILRNVRPDADVSVLEELEIPLRQGKLEQTRDPYTVSAADYAVFLPVICDPAGSSATASAADFNGNGEVDIYDLATLLEAIGQSSKGAPVDGNYAVGDTIIDLGDAP